MEAKTHYIIKNNDNEVTLKLDLGDRSAEEIQQIAEKFANEPTTTILVPSNESEIRKQVAKEIFNVLEKIEKEGRAVLPKGFLVTGRKAYGVEVDDE